MRSAGTLRAPDLRVGPETQTGSAALAAPRGAGARYLSPYCLILR